MYTKKYYVKTKTLYRAAMVAFGFALCALVALPAVAGPTKLADIQWEGNRYHKKDYAAADAIRLGKPVPPIDNAWQELEKGDVGSCTHTVAIKYRWLKEAGYMPVVVVVTGYPANHTYVVVPKNDTSGYWKLDNYGEVQSIDVIHGWRGTLEQARIVWDE